MFWGGSKGEFVQESDMPCKGWRRYPVKKNCNLRVGSFCFVMECLWSSLLCYISCNLFGIPYCAICHAISLEFVMKMLCWLGSQWVFVLWSLDFMLKKISLRNRSQSKRLDGLGFSPGGQEVWSVPHSWTETDDNLEPLPLSKKWWIFLHQFKADNLIPLESRRKWRFSSNWFLGYCCLDCVAYFVHHPFPQHHRMQKNHAGYLLKECISLIKLTWPISTKELKARKTIS